MWDIWFHGQIVYINIDYSIINKVINSQIWHPMAANFLALWVWALFRMTIVYSNIYKSWKFLRIFSSTCRCPQSSSSTFSSLATTSSSFDPKCKHIAISFTTKLTSSSHALTLVSCCCRCGLSGSLASCHINQSLFSTHH